jgi:hypothetical protein
VSAHAFLSIARLERLYNADLDRLQQHLVGGAAARHRRCSRTRGGHLKSLPREYGEEEEFAQQRTITLPEIGFAIERLMGNAYRCELQSLFCITSFEILDYDLNKFINRCYR